MDIENLNDTIELSVDPTVPVDKKKSPLKIALITLAAIVGVFMAVVLFVLFNPGLQMKFFTNYVMKNLSAYNWSALQMSDPVKPTLTEALGAEKAESVDALYNFMKDSASRMEWEITEIDKENLTTKVDVKYVVGDEFLTEYGYELGDYIVSSLDAGDIGLADMQNILNIIPDEDNAMLLKNARENSGVLGDKIKYEETTVTVNFEKGMICMPSGTSDEVNDVASAGLTKSLEGMTTVVAVHVIPQVIDRIFHAFQTFDEAEIEKYTGSKISTLLGIDDNSSAIYQAIYTYLKSCAAKMEYQVGTFDQNTGEIAIDCSYLDSKNVISEYITQIAMKSMTNLFVKNPDPIDYAALLNASVEAVEEQRVEATVTITFDMNDFGKFQVSDEINDVVSANLYSVIGPYLKYFNF